MFRASVGLRCIETPMLTKVLGELGVDRSRVINLLHAGHCVGRVGPECLSHALAFNQDG